MGYGHLHPPGTTRTIGRRSGAQLLSCLVKNAARSRWSFEVRLKWSSLWLRAWHSCEISWNDGKILRYLRWKEDPGFVKKLHCSAVSASGLTGLTLIQLFFAMKRDWCSNVAGLVFLLHHGVGNTRSDPFRDCRHLQTISPPACLLLAAWEAFSVGLSVLEETPPCVTKAWKWYDGRKPSNASPTSFFNQSYAWPLPSMG